LSTIIDIATDVDSSISNGEDAYYQRTEVTAKIKSNTKFDRIFLFHLGFRASRVSQKSIYLRGGRYISYALLDPNGAASVLIAPFRLTLQNIGDSFCRVNVRMPHGMERCKMTIFQEEYQPKQPKEVDDFIKYEDIWYATATINCLQTIRIEEVGDV